jgi:UDP-galactopyranose mutase
VEEYVKTFSSWVPYEHRVLGEVRDINGTNRIVPIPPNIGNQSNRVPGHYPMVETLTESSVQGKDILSVKFSQRTALVFLNIY